LAGIWSSRSRLFRGCPCFLNYSHIGLLNRLPVPWSCLPGRIRFAHRCVHCFTALFATSPPEGYEVGRIDGCGSVPSCSCASRALATSTIGTVVSSNKQHISERLHRRQYIPADPNLRTVPMGLDTTWEDGCDGLDPPPSQRVGDSPPVSPGAVLCLNRALMRGLAGHGGWGGRRSRGKGGRDSASKGKFGTQPPGPGPRLRILYGCPPFRETMFLFWPPVHPGLTGFRWRAAPSARRTRPVGGRGGCLRFAAGPHCARGAPACRSTLASPSPLVAFEEAVSITGFGCLWLYRPMPARSSCSRPGFCRDLGTTLRTHP